MQKMSFEEEHPAYELRMSMECPAKSCPASVEGRFWKKLLSLTVLSAGLFGLSRTIAEAQIFMSVGSYSQHFDSLGSTANGWTNNVTLPGWYASKGSSDAENHLAGSGSANTGGIYSFGVNGVGDNTDRALGSVASSSTTTISFGARFINDTTLAQTNITVTYTGEQWRNGGNTATHVLAFFYQVANSPITNTYASSGWTSFNPLNFNSPATGGSSSALDGNAPENRQVFADVVLTGVVVQPSQELFLRWVDVDDSGFDHGLAIDDLKVAFGDSVPPPPPPPASTNTLTLVQFNVKGNDVADWSTNSPQVRAIGRQLTYLNPDIITFNEIPFDLTWELTNWGKDFLSGYNIVANSGTDGFIRSAIASRHPIVRSTKWLDGADLKAFGYTNANPALDNFTRDLFEAEIDVPGFPQRLHVLTTHLKAGGTSEDFARRAAEAAAITNFFATNLFVQYPLHPYLLTGDMNTTDTSTLAIQRLISMPTGLHLTNPRNPVTGSINTFSIQGSLNSRLDYIFSGDLLVSNIRTSMVFRTDLLNPLPPNLNNGDSATASDHLPVVIVFSNPYDKPVQISSVSRSDENVSLSWDSVPGQPYTVEVSTNLTTWTVFATNLLATANAFTLVTNSTDGTSFFRIYRVP